MGREQPGEKLSGRNQSHRKGPGAIGDTTGNRKNTTASPSSHLTIFSQSFLLLQPTWKLEARKPGTCSFFSGSNGKTSVCDLGDLAMIAGLRGSREKETATHSSILAWKIPWMEEPGGLQSMGSRESDMTEQLIL